jgi:putative transposase
MSVASFVAAQRTDHGVPHVISCRALEVSESWFYKWRDRPPTPREQRRAQLDAAVKASFEDSEATYGSPRVLADLLEWGWKVSKKSVEASMARQAWWLGPSDASAPSPGPTRPPHPLLTCSGATSRPRP